MRMLTMRRQSKLSQDQLLELQKSTHFDKRELQQWYKGESSFIPFPSPFLQPTIPHPLRAGTAM